MFVEGLAMRILLTACECNFADVVRVKRSWWMRLLLKPMRLYHCGKCKSNILASKHLVEYSPGLDSGRVWRPK